MRLILLGPPGSGKGTVAEKIERNLSFFHLSPGEILREEVKKDTTLGKEIKKYIEKGHLVPNEFVVELVKLNLKGKKKVILDGFPRSLDQAKAINDLKIDLVVYLDVPKDIIIKRFSGRRVCQKNNHGFNVHFLPPKKKGICDYDGSPLIKRKDDRPQVIKERFKIYQKETKPLIAYYKQKKLLKVVNGAQDPDQVYADVKALLK